MKNSTGSQPWHISLKPRTARTTSLDGLWLFAVCPIFRRCISPPSHMVAPLSGKIVILVLRLLGTCLACFRSGFGENGTIYVSISLIWPVSLNVYVPVAWLNIMWAMSVSIAASLAPSLFSDRFRRFPSPTYPRQVIGLPTITTCLFPC